MAADGQIDKRQMEADLLRRAVLATRGHFGWSQRDFADAVGVARTTIVAFETGRAGTLGVTAGAMRAAIEKAGVRYWVDDEGALVVRFARAAFAPE